MLLTLSQWLSENHPHFQVFDYLTLRAILAALTALIFSMLFGPLLIKYLTVEQIGQVVRSEGPQSHLKKTGTPTMGGLLILTAIITSVLLWIDLTNRFIWPILLITIGFGVIGWLDDYLKLSKRNTKGLSGKKKLLFQSILTIIALFYLYHVAIVDAELQLFFPFFKNMVFNLGWFYFVLAYFVIVGASNAVNLTDGLDGLAIMPSVLIGGALGVFAYVTGNVNFSEYLLIPYIPDVGELVIVAAALVGAGLGFLWYNTYPAQIFMGDVGALALGGLLGIMAVIVNQELVFFIMGGVFVVETLSVIIQVGSYKLRGKRVFKMAPIHHHFELKGIAEPKVIVRFWIITFVLVLIGLAMLKIR